MSVQGLKKLKVWVRAKDYALDIYRQILPVLPAEEKWNLNQQLRRSSLSVSANIAEGFGRYYFQDNVRFCYNARGSMEETLSHLTFAVEMQFISTDLYTKFAAEGEEIDKMLNAYIAHLKQSKQGFNEPGAGHSAHEDPGSYSLDLEDASSLSDYSH